ncbi:FtsX-like permease family protein [Acidobacteria bacterium ACD]|nr:MAG: FtsX-like permease family protein [Acidobacteriota bacterium]MCE7958080.1 ABC transporter permease [Acidobacteria bacterium ACB2]MDL1948601.1 FtsX-like permease family protein [Acidobacteria bacterium ACD]
MLNGELLRVAGRAIGAHKLRSFLTLLGVIIAVMTVVAVVSVISGLNNYVATKLFTLSPDVYVVTRFGIITSHDEFLEALKRKRISRDDYEAVLKLARSAVAIGTQANTTKPVKSGSERIPDVNIAGITPNVAEMQNLDLDAGRFFTEVEDERRAFVAVIGSEVREELFPRVDPIGRTVSIDGTPFRVIGLLVKQGSVLGQSQDNIVYVPRSTMAKVFGSRRGVSLFVKARGGVPGIPASMEEMRVIFRALRHTPTKAPDPVSFVTAEAIQVVWRSISAGAFALLVFISGISLVVGAIVIANIMLVSVIERTKEIGLRLAVGARKRDIRRQFLLEAALLAFGGGAVGVFLGWVVALSVDAFSPLPTRVTPGLVVTGLLLATLTGLIAGAFPAVKASRLPPIEALRWE